MTFHWPQITYLSIMAFCLLVAAAKNGEPTNTKHNFPVVLCFAGFYFWLLWQGGFYSGTSP